MDMSFLCLAGFVVICAFLIIILYSIGAKKLYSYNDVKYTMPTNTNSFTPIVYELTYVSNTGGAWTFVQDSNIQKFVLDVKHGKITFVIIKGNLYQIENVSNMSSKIVLHLIESCATTKSFIPCGLPNDAIGGGSAYTVIHVIGYRL